MEINNKYNLNDTAYVFTRGKIIKVTITRIDIIIGKDNINIAYNVSANNDYAQEYLEYIGFEEDELSPTIEDIINHIEVL